MFISRARSSARRFTVGLVTIVLAAITLVGFSPASGAATSGRVFAGPLRIHAGATNWAGNVVNGNAYTDAEASWVVPPATLPAGGSVLHWVGVGLGNSTTYPLLQAGTATDVGSGSYVWIETYPYNALTRISYFGSVDNHTISVHVTFTASGGAAIHIHDATNGRDQQCTTTNTACKIVTRAGMRPDGHAEWITESVGSKLVAEFGAVNFKSVEAYSPATGWKGVGNLPHYAMTMENANNQPRVAPYNIGSDEQSFTNYWFRGS